MADRIIIAKDKLIYNPENGLFTWKVSCGRKRTGDRAGCPSGNGYIAIKIDGKRYLAHRLAWLYMTGEWPKDQIDHRNRSRGDNRWNNLREATASQNQANSKRRGLLKGVTRYRNKWMAQIKINQKTHFLGNFDSIDKAHAAYVVAAAVAFGEYARAT